VLGRKTADLPVMEVTKNVLSPSSSANPRMPSASLITQTFVSVHSFPVLAEEIFAALTAASNLDQQQVRTE